MEQTDDVLIAALARSFDRRSGGELIARHQAAVYGIVSRILRDPASADDAVQETFLRVLRSAGRFRGGSAVRTWIYRIAVNVALEAERRNSSVAHRERSARVPTPPASGLSGELEDAVARLAPEDRAAVALRYERGLPLKDVAAALGCAPGTVPSRLDRALRRLRVLLACAPFALAGLADLEARLSRLPAPAVPAGLSKTLSTLALSCVAPKRWIASPFVYVGAAVLLIASAAGLTRAIGAPEPRAAAKAVSVKSWTGEAAAKAPAPALGESPSRWMLRAVCKLRAMWKEASDSPSSAFWRDVIALWDEGLADPALASIRGRLAEQRALWEATARVFDRVREGRWRHDPGTVRSASMDHLLPFAGYREAGYRIEWVFTCATAGCAEPKPCQQVLAHQFFYPSAKAYPLEAIAKDPAFLRSVEDRLGVAVFYHLNWTHSFARRAIDESGASAAQAARARSLVEFIWAPLKLTDDERTIVEALSQDADALVRAGAALILDAGPPPAIHLPPDPPRAPVPPSQEKDLFDPDPEIRSRAFSDLEPSLRTREKTPLAREMFERYPQDGPAVWFAREVVQRKRQDEASIQWSVEMIRVILARAQDPAVRAEAEEVLRRLDQDLLAGREARAGEAGLKARIGQETADALRRWQGHDAAGPVLTFLAAWAVGDLETMAGGVADRVLQGEELPRDDFLKGLAEDWKWPGRSLGDVFALDALRVQDRDALRLALSKDDALFRHAEPDFKNQATRMLAAMRDADLWVHVPRRDAASPEFHFVLRRVGSVWRIAVFPS